MNHRQRHPSYTEGCWACKVLSVSISAEATPNRRPEPVRVAKKDRALGDDLAAYKRLRRDGLQPQTIDGSADAEKRVNSQWDFDLGRIVPKNEESRVAEAMAISRELGYVTEAGR